MHTPGVPSIHTGMAHALDVALTKSMFGAEAMEAEGGVAFEAMKVAQLKEELTARDSMRTGLNATLQRRLHSLLVQGALSGSDSEGEA